MEEKFDREKVVSFLLGSLSEAEMESFDELSITSDEFNYELAEAENDLVDAYLTGDLVGERLEKFKSHYLASPLRRERLNFARALRSSEGTFAAPEITHAAVASDERDGFFATIAALFSTRAIAAGFAAVLVLFAIGGIWFVLNRRSEPERAIQNPPDERLSPSTSPPASSQNEVAHGKEEVPNSNGTNKPEPPSTGNERKPSNELTPTPRPRIEIATFVLTPPLRSGGVPSLTVTKNTTDLAFALKLESNEHSAYRVTLTDESGKRLWSSNTLRASGPGDEKVVNVRLPAKFVGTGVHMLRLSGGSSPIADYTFDLQVNK